MVFIVDNNRGSLKGDRRRKVPQSPKTEEMHLRTVIRATQNSQLGLGKRSGRVPSLPTIRLPHADDSDTEK